jgi:AcrR family transcriptional regulator
MSKGQLTRQAILEHAVGVATVVGLEGLSIGRLAEELKLSKSGLFAHFQSKEALQVQVLDAAAARFVDEVVRPSLGAPRGEPRLRALFEGWLAWGRNSLRPGGCFFVNAAFELDAREGAARERLVALQQDWLDTLATAARSGISTGAFRADIDAEQFAHDLYGAILAWHHAARLLRDPRAEIRLRSAFETLLRNLKN